ncbi:MAG: DUF3592 domain-containing protein [Lachnospiraceae bacterium]|nr:DUF3592 domain-containing protein [Lachnospiraceae bacterium]
MSDSLWIKGVICIILGLAADIAGLVLKFYSAQKRPYAGYADAKVVEIIPVERDRNAEAYFRNRQAAVFEFFADGKLIKLVDQEDAYPCPYELGQRIQLCYDPDDPEKYVVLHENKEHFQTIALNSLGVLLIVAGVLLFLRYAMRYNL